MPIIYALFSLLAGMLAYGTSIRLDLPLWIAAQLTLVAANLGVGLVVLILASHRR